MTTSADSVFVARSDGISAEGVRDQYADGKAAKVWEIFIGDKNSRTDNYKNFLIDMLRKKGCKRVLDVACGTGVDSLMLVEEGFEVVSVDASDKMLKYALKERWNRRKEASFDNWIIEEANWLTLYDDIQEHIKDGFDAVICLGNSFAHLMDGFGDQREHKQAIRNFEKCLKPGGVLLIDHRNYDNILETGATPAKNKPHGRHQDLRALLLRQARPGLHGLPHRGQQAKQRVPPLLLSPRTEALPGHPWGDLLSQSRPSVVRRLQGDEPSKESRLLHPSDREAAGLGFKQLVCIHIRPHMTHPHKNIYTKLRRFT
ncbi:hypothetical protein KR026_007703 [Drosophila bipectinata]|nr:hypothetical protein KR026_007703 [Drosophila bipectinata]